MMGDLGVWYMVVCGMTGQSGFNTKKTKQNRYFMMMMMMTMGQSDNF